MADKITAAPTKDGVSVTRLITGVELKLQTSGKHWTLSAKPANK